MPYTRMAIPLRFIATGEGSVSLRRGAGMTWQEAGIAFTFLLGVWNLVFNFRNSKRTTFINTVTAERIKWIQSTRETASSLLGRTYYWFMTQDELKQEESNEIRKDIDRLRMLVKLQLNPKGELDQDIISLINEMPKYTNKIRETEMKELLEQVVQKMQLLLKQEWDKVKEESVHGDLKTKGGFWQI